MDNLTHSLVGLAAAKAGLERVSPGATVLAIVAANAPDADIVTLYAGQFTYLEHHRGITHSLIGAAVIAIALPVVFYAGDRLVSTFSRRRPRARFFGLLVTSLLLSASHLLLDYTNNYGVRPLLPWDSRWFYGDLVFIFDPWIWLMLGGACFLLTARTHRRVLLWAALAVILTAAIFFVLPQRFGLASPHILWLLWTAALAALMLARRAGAAPQHREPELAAVALALVVVYWGALSILHARALAQAQTTAQDLAGSSGETLLRVAAMPAFANPLEWVCVAETNRALNRFDVRIGDERGGGAARKLEKFEKPLGANRELVERAGTDRRAEIFLSFSRFPATRIRQGGINDAIVQFADLRFADPGSPQRGSFTLEVPVTIGPPQSEPQQP